MSEPTSQTNVNNLIEGANQLGIDLSDEQVGQFARYLELLRDWNQRFNLTALRDSEQIQRRLFLDSLTCSLVTGDLNQQSLIDVGSGAGFPGLPLKILFPDLRLHLVESVGKKASFLDAVAAELDLAHVAVINGRAEWIGQSVEHRQVYDWAVARALARLPVLVEFLLPLLRIGGHLLAQKGQQAAKEMGEAEKAISILGGGPPRLHAVQIADQDELSNLVIIEKCKPTPAQYPRRVGIPAKRPL